MYNFESGETFYRGCLSTCVPITLIKYVLLKKIMQILFYMIGQVA